MSKTSSMFSGTGPQAIAAFIATVSAISDGMHYGWTAPVIPLLRDPSSPLPITVADETWLESIYLIGGMAGLPFTIYFVNKIGRKNLLIATSFASLASWILIALAADVRLLYAARFTAGLAGDVAFVATPMYVAEIADQKIRGFLSSLIYLMMLFGILLIYSIAPFAPFYLPSLVAAVLLTFQILTAFRYMPKSPYFLITRGRMAEAKQALDRLRSGKDNALELEVIRAGIERQEREKGRPQDLLLVKSNRKAATTVCVLNALQLFCGFGVLLMNLHTILTAAGSIYLKATTSAICFSSIMFVAATFSSFNMDRYGRKFLLTISSISTGCCLLALAVYFHLQYRGYDLASVSWIPVACVMIYAACFKCGLGMVPIVVSAELFSNKMKAIGMAAGDVMYLVFGLLSIEFYEGVRGRFGFHVVFYVFAAVACFGSVFTSCYMIETKGRTLEEIQMLLKGESVNREEEKALNSKEVGVLA